MKIYGMSLRYDTLGYGVGFTTATMTFPLDSTIETSPFVLKSVDGLGPPNIDVSINNTLYSGGVFQARKPQLRQIIMRIGFQPNYAIGQTVGDLRSQLHEWLTPKFGIPIKVALLGSTGLTVLYTSAWASKLDPNIFSKDPEVVLTLDCTSPYFITDPVAIASPGSLPKTSFSITNPGDAPTGFMMQYTMTGSTGSILLSDRMTRRFWVNYSFISGDVITLNTNSGSRNVSLLRSGVTTSLLPYQQPSSEWLQMFGGVNYFTMNTSNYNYTAITLYPNYWGI